MSHRTINDTSLEWQNVEQSLFEQCRRQLYVPRKSDFDTLDAFMASDRQCLVVTGDSGAGKSALLANWMDDYQKRFQNVYFLSHYISASIDSEASVKILFRLTGILDPESVKPETEANRLENLSKKTQNLSAIVRKFGASVTKYRSEHPGQKLVIVLEGLDHLCSIDETKKLVWFPMFPEDVKVIFSTVETDSTFPMLERRNYQKLTLDPLSDVQRKEIIGQYSDSRSCSLTDDRIARIAEDGKFGNPLVLRTFLDELCAPGDQDKLNERIDGYLAAENPEKFFAGVLECLESDCGLKETETILTALVAARYGLSEKELIDLTGYAPETVATLLTRLSTLLIRRSGLYNYNNDTFRSAVLARYASPLKSTQKRLLEYFLSDKNESFSRKCLEVPWYYENQERWSDLNAFLLNFAVMKELFYKTTDCDFCYWWSTLVKNKYDLDAYLKLDVSGDSKQDQADNWYRLANLAELFPIYDLVKRGYTKALAVYRELAASDPETCQPFLAQTLTNLASIHKKIKKPDQAEKEFNEALTIYRKLVMGNPGVFRPKLAKLLSQLGDFHHDTNRNDQAEKEFKEAIAIRRDLAAKQPADYQGDFIMTQFQLGCMYKETGRPNLAEKEFKEAMPVLRKCVVNEPTYYREYLAMMLNNQALLHSEIGKINLAKADLDESLAIYRSLAVYSPATYRAWIAETLNSQGALYLHVGPIELAEAKFRETLAIYRELAVESPKTYRQYVAMALNNLASLHCQNERLDLAQAEYNEVLEMYRELAKTDPAVFKPYMAMVMLNIAILYATIGQKEFAEAILEEALTISNDLAVNFSGSYQSYYKKCLELREWLRNQ